MTGMYSMLMSRSKNKNRFAGVIRHVPHEGLGLIEQSLIDASIEFKYFSPDASGLSQAGFDMLIIMGGPASVYDNYPWLQQETGIIKRAVAQQAPVLGICLGAQLIAAALGAEVMPCAGKEIGWYPLAPTLAAGDDPLLSCLGVAETVFQWHGDTFALPAGAELLASSPLCPHQAFRFGRAVYGLQFHLEVTGAMVSDWLSVPGNQVEVNALRGEAGAAEIESDTGRYSARLQALGKDVFDAFTAL